MKTLVLLLALLTAGPTLADGLKIHDMQPGRIDVITHNCNSVVPDSRCPDPTFLSF